MIQIYPKNTEELLHALTNKETFNKILDQGVEIREVGEYIKGYLRENPVYIIDYFMRIIDLSNTDELRFY